MPPSGFAAGGDDPPEICLDGVARTYPGAIPVRALRSTTLRIASGEMVAVTGRSGSGKSTLLNILGLLDRPTSGHYLIRGVDTSTLRESTLTALRGRQFGFVFQAYHLLADRTARENVEMGLLYRAVQPRRRRAAATAALDRVGLSHRIDATPDTLSGGERQRVAVARALAQQPRVLLCDEPTGNLDRRNAEIVFALLDSLHADGLTIVAVTHDEEFAGGFPRRVHVDDGVVDEVTAMAPPLPGTPQ